MIRCFIALGANLGDPIAQVREAATRLAAHPRICRPRLSPLYLSDPVGILDQPRFANAVMELHTELGPLALLEECHVVENAMGRVRGLRWGPRNIDLDILFYGELQLKDPRLEIPHPRWNERPFVVAPLHDLAPDLSVMGVGVAALLASMDCSGIEKIS